MGAPKVMGLGLGGSVLRRVRPYLTLDLRIAGSELFVNLDGRHWNNVCEWWLPI